MDRICVRSLDCPGSPLGAAGRALFCGRSALDRPKDWRRAVPAGKNGSVIIAISTPLARLIRGNGLLKNAAKQLSFTVLGRVTGAGVGRLRLKHLIQPT